jgi:hypothetical protein
MPYHVYTRSGVGAVGVIVETAKEALAKAAELLEEGHREVIFKDLLGNVLDRTVVVIMAEIEVDRCETTDAPTDDLQDRDHLRYARAVKAGGEATPG